MVRDKEYIFAIFKFGIQYLYMEHQELFFIVDFCYFYCVILRFPFIIMIILHSLMKQKSILTIRNNEIFLVKLLERGKIINSDKFVYNS